MLRLHVDSSAIFLEVQSDDGAKPLLVNLAHVATIEPQEQSARDVNATQQREIEVLPLHETLSSLKGCLAKIEAPFAKVPRGSITEIMSDPLKGGYVLHIGGGDLLAAQVATVSRLARWSSLISP